jgi:hypothetical protein
MVAPKLCTMVAPARSMLVSHATCHINVSRPSACLDAYLLIPPFVADNYSPHFCSAQ